MEHRYKKRLGESNMPEIKNAMGANGGFVQADSAGHIMVTAPAGNGTPSPHLKMK